MMASDRENLSPGSSAGLIPCSEDRQQEPKQDLRKRKSTGKERGKWPPQKVKKQPREPFKAIENFPLELRAHQTSLPWLESLEAETVTLEEEIENFLPELGAEHTYLTLLESPEDETVNPEEIWDFIPELRAEHASLPWLESLEAETVNPEKIGNFLLELGEQQTSLTWLESSEAKAVNLEEIVLQDQEAQELCMTWLEFSEDEVVNPVEIENFLPELGAETVTPKEDVDEIDLPDVNNVQSGVQHVKRLYAFYNEQQHVNRPSEYMSYRTEINAGMRVKLVRALILVHSELHLQPETLYLAVSIVDRFLSLHHVPRTHLHLVGISSLLIATKYEEDWVPKVQKFIRVSAAEFSNEELCFYEKEVLNTLDWYLSVPTVYMFLIRYIKAARADEELENQIYHYGRTGLMEYSLILYCPSMVAAATVYAARCTLKRFPLWTDTLQRHSSYSEAQLLYCANIIVRASINY